MQYMNNKWIVGQGEMLTTNNPATGALAWEGRAASAPQVEEAIQAAQDAFNSWRRTPLTARIELLQRYATCLESQQLSLAECIAEETGKPLWESKTEVASMISKVTLSIDAYHQRTGESEKPLPNGISIVKHKPIGVMAVLGPFNFPGHLPNGHIVPALLAGNTIIFKPSELTPQTAIFMMKVFQTAGFPEGVLNLILGKGEVGQALTSHRNVNGILFTGSYATGKKLHLQCAGQPEKMLALEMGGNNPLIVWGANNTQAVAYHIIQSAFISAGQRCTCARRLIISEGEEGEKIVSSLQKWMEGIRVAYWRTNPEPFMGPVISVTAANQLLERQTSLIKQGGESMVAMRHLNAETGLLTPGLIDVTSIKKRDDVELFGPLLQIIRVHDFDEAMEVANETNYGLAAGLQSDSRVLYDKFYDAIQAGVLSWNRPTTGASSAAPFGGIGWSGNYRPGAYYAADYCAYPVASTETSLVEMPATLTPGVQL